MISWIQNHLIRHGRWIFLTLLAVIIVAFVFTIGNTPGFAPRADGREADLFYGVNFNAPREFEPLRDRVVLSQIVSTGRPPATAEQLDQSMRGRVAFLYLADQLQIPGPNEPQMGEFVRSRPIFRGPDGNFDRNSYIAFLDDLESDPGISQNLLAVVLAEDYRIGKVIDALSGPGNLLDEEVLIRALREETEVEVSVASTRFSAFRPEIEVDAESLEAFFATDQERYREPERIDSLLVRFRTDPLSVEVSDEELTAYFEENRERFVAAHQATLDNSAKGEDAETTAAEIGFEDVRAAVLREVRRQRAERRGNERAHEFAFTLYDRGIARDSETLAELIRQSGAAVEVIEPFSADEVTGRSYPRALLEAAFTLTPNRYFTGATRLPNGDFGILIFQGRIESYIPELADIRRDVEADYRREERNRLFAENGRGLVAALNERIAEGMDFEEAAKELELTVDTYEAFKLGQAPSELGRSLTEHLTRMEAGAVSPMMTSDGVGRIAFVRERNVPEISRDDESFAEMAEWLQSFSAAASSRSLLAELIERGLSNRR